MRFDLHIHTNYSDGSMPVEEAVAFAARIGLGGIAITDHDTMGMLSRAQKAAREHRVEVIAGVELSTTDSVTGRKVHLLVYLPQTSEPLEPIFSRMAERRRESGEQMMALACQQYSVTPEQIRRQTQTSVAPFRVHILRALMELGYGDAIYGTLYRTLFANPNGCCYVPTQYTDLMEAAVAARKTGGIVVLAHPGVYNSFGAAHRLAAAGLLDGLEMEYPRKKADQAAMHEELIRQYDLIPTGGTDFHGFYTSVPRPIGTCTAGEDTLCRMYQLLQTKERLHHDI